MSDGWDDASVDGHTHELPVAADDAHGPLRSLRYERLGLGLGLGSGLGLGLE